MDAAGVTRAHAIGDVVVEARHEGLVGLFSLRVLPDGTYVVTGAVIPALGARQARVEASWAGQTRIVETHPDDGSYRLLGVVGAVRLGAWEDGGVGAWGLNRDAPSCSEREEARSEREELPLFPPLRSYAPTFPRSYATTFPRSWYRRIRPLSGAPTRRMSMTTESWMASSM